jgi:hypothetical protein
MKLNDLLNYDSAIIEVPLGGGLNGESIKDSKLLLAYLFE